MHRGVVSRVGVLNMRAWSLGWGMGPLEAWGCGTSLMGEASKHGDRDWDLYG